MSGIYTITNLINNKIYVGYSIDFSVREYDHFKELLKNRHGNQYLQSSFNKYGESNFKFEILEECDEDFLASQENYWANMLNTHNRKYGYNIKPTHPDNRFITSVETRLKIRKALKGRPCPNLEQLIEINKNRDYSRGYKLSEDHKSKISMGGKGKLLGKKKSKEHISNLKNAKKGIKLSEEHKNNIKISLKGKVHNITERGLRGFSLNKGGAIFQYDLDGNFIKEWECSYDIRKELNINMANITACCRGRKKSAYKYRWKYKSKVI